MVDKLYKIFFYDRSISIHGFTYDRFHANHTKSNSDCKQELIYVASTTSYYKIYLI